MSVSFFAEGTQTVTSTSEYTLASVNATGVFQWWLDAINMTTGDVTVLRAYRTTKASGTSRLFQIHVLYGTQSTENAVFRTDGLASPSTQADSLKFTLQQVFGVPATASSSRAYDYGVDRVA